jgi:hypothetical protein
VKFCEILGTDMFLKKIIIYVRLSTDLRRYWACIGTKLSTKMG